MKRINTIDAMRGIGILGITPIHSLLIFTNSFRTSPENMMWNPLLAAPYFFFFISGMCLSLSVVRRRKLQNLREIFMHGLIRYGGYIFISIAMSVSLTMLFTYLISGKIDLSTIYQDISNWGEPIRGIGLACLFSLIPVYYLSTRKLLLSSIGIFIFSSVILHLIPSSFSYGVLTPIAFSGLYSLLKTVPAVLFGAMFGNMIAKNYYDKNDNPHHGVLIPERKVFLAGLSVILMVELAFLILTIRNSWNTIGINVAEFITVGDSKTGMLFLKLGGPYYVTAAFSLGGFMLLLGMSEMLRRMGFHFRYITFVGRTGIQIFIVHFLLLILEIWLFGAVIPANAMLALIMFNSILMYLFSYVYVEANVSGRIRRLVG
ncbi:MAG TPA: hypothetical protein ENF42_03880 [Candidatus Bathyarchaeota archaeon]|nr:hypothetical protein [Candidatus Bathyarchaeota archaeon]